MASFQLQVIPNQALIDPTAILEPAVGEQIQHEIRFERATTPPLRSPDFRSNPVEPAAARFIRHLP